MACDPVAGQFHILYFGSTGSYTNKATECFPAPIRLPALYPLLEERYPGIMHKILPSCSVAVNLEYHDINDTSMEIKAGDEVAIIPPVSSG